MLNPVLSSVKNFYTYLIVWAILIIVHTIVLSYCFNLWFLFSFWDALVFNLLFSAFAIGLWYPVRFMKLDKSNKFTVLLYHLVAAAFSLFVWIELGTFLLKLLTLNNREYALFFQSSVPIRSFLGLLYYSITILFYYLFLYYISFKENLLKATHLSALVKETQLELLKSQLNPHFIFNALNSISSLTLSAPEKAQEMVVKLSEFLRYTLGEKNKLVSLGDEMEKALLYLDIEKIRFGDRLKIELKLAKDTLEVQIPELILQPLIENAVKYGMYETLEQVKISVNSERKNAFCKIIIRNDLKERKRLKPGKGLGIKNVRERLQLVYGKGNWLETSIEAHRFIVVITVPV